MAALSSFKLHEADEFRYFAPKTWFFWRGVIINFCVFCLVGHWLEIPYCMFMDWAFHVVADDYDVWTDPLWVPYWVYGLGTVFITLSLLPLKIHILEQRKTMWGAVLQFFVIAVVVCALLELVIGLLINQPDATGHYPFWDNSALPLNIFVARERHHSRAYRSAVCVCCLSFHSARTFAVEAQHVRSYLPLCAHLLRCSMHLLLRCAAFSRALRCPHEPQFPLAELIELCAELLLR